MMQIMWTSFTQEAQYFRKYRIQGRAFWTTNFFTPSDNELFVFASCNLVTRICWGGGVRPPSCNMLKLWRSLQGSCYVWLLCCKLSCFVCTVLFSCVLRVLAFEHLAATTKDITTWKLLTSGPNRICQYRVDILAARQDFLAHRCN